VVELPAEHRFVNIDFLTSTRDHDEAREIGIAAVQAREVLELAELLEARIGDLRAVQVEFRQLLEWPQFFEARVSTGALRGARDDSPREVPSQPENEPPELPMGSAAAARTSFVK
jgi:hypothetical protein